MQLTRHTEASSYQFGDLGVRELSPEAMEAGSMAEITVPIGIERPARVSEKVDRVYVGLAGRVEFTVEGEVVTLGGGDVIHIARGEEYGFVNQGREEARLLLFRSPRPAPPSSG